MELSNSAKAKLLAWLQNDTWHTKHDLDMGRWYAFVDHYQRDHGFEIDEGVLHYEITRLARCEENDELQRVVSERIGLAYSILDFLKFTKR